MPIKLELIEEGHILWFQIDGTWTSTEIADAKEKTQRVYREAQHTIHALVDLRHAQVNVPLLMASRQVIGGELLPNAGQIAIIGVSRMLRMVAEPILRMADSTGSVIFFGTIEEAKAYLKQLIMQGG